MQSHAGGYFIRLTVHDRVGVFASIAKRMAENAISLESIVQRTAEPGAAEPDAKTVILITHETNGGGGAQGAGGD